MNKHAPQKEKYVRGNQSPFMTKTLSKAIMQSSELRNYLLKNKTEENRDNLLKQRNLCYTDLRKSKREFCGSLNEQDLCDNRKYWRLA